MGQYWMIINIDKREILKNDGGTKLGSILCSGVTAKLAPLLAKPRLPARKQSDRDPSGRGRNTISNTQNDSALLNVPIEILVYMATSIFSPTDVICLALTCKLLWETLHQNVCRALTAGHGSWAGDRLLLLDDYTDKLPTGLLTLTEEEELSIWSGRDCKCVPHGSSQCEYDQNCCWEGTCCEGEPQRLQVYRFVQENYQDRCPDTVFREAKFMVCDELVEDLERLEDLASELFAFPAGQWVLRELTARQYVRLEAIAKHRGERGAPDGHDLELLGDAVVLFTEWTDDPSGIIRELHGNWAGHRFDFCQMNEIQNDMGSAWKDVSSDAKERLIQAEVLGPEGEDDSD